MAAIEIRNLSKTFAGRGRALDGVSLSGEGFMTGSDARADAAADYGANLRLKLQLN